MTSNVGTGPTQILPDTRRWWRTKFDEWISTCMLTKKGDAIIYETTVNIIYSIVRWRYVFTILGTIYKEKKNEFCLTIIIYIFLLSRAPRQHRRTK